MTVSAYRITQKPEDIELAIWNCYVDHPYIPPTVRFGSSMLEILGIEDIKRGVDPRVAELWKILIDQSRRISRDILFLIPMNVIYCGDIIVRYMNNSTPAEIMGYLEEVEGFYL